MPNDFEELKRQLLQSDEEYRQLATQHHALDEQIHNLSDRPYLTQPEQFEEVQMENIIRRHRTDGVSRHAAHR